MSSRQLSETMPNSCEAAPIPFTGILDTPQLAEPLCTLSLFSL